MIDAIKIAGLRNNEYAQFIQNICAVVQRYDPNVLMVQDDYAKLKAYSDSMNGVLNETAGSTITDELVAFDTKRDDAINGLIAMVNANSYSEDADTKAAANTLANHLAGFGAIARDSYQSETSKLQKIAADWNTKSDLKAAVIKLNLADWVTRMVAANTAFDNRYVDRSVDTGLTATEQDKVYNKRPEVNAAYYELRLQIDSWYNIKKKAAPWSTVTAALNGVIKDYNDLLANRGTNDDGTSGGGITPPPTA